MPVSGASLTKSEGKVILYTEGIATSTQMSVVPDTVGMTAEEADYWAKWQVMQEFGTSALYDLSIGLAYGLGRSDNSVKRSLFRK